MNIQTRHDVEVLLQQRNTSILKMSHELGVSSQSIYQTLRGKPSQTITKHIEKKLSRPFSVISKAWNNKQN